MPPTQEPPLDREIRQRLRTKLLDYVRNVMETAPKEGDATSIVDRLVQRAAELATGSPEKPGVFCLVRSREGQLYLTDESWVAWDYTSDGGGRITVTYTDVAGLDAGRKRSPIEQIKSQVAVTTRAAAAYLRAAKGDVELACDYAERGPGDPDVKSAITDNPPPHLRFAVLTGEVPGAALDMAPGEPFWHYNVPISPVLAQRMLDHYTRAPGQRPFNEHWVHTAERAVREGQRRIEEIVVAHDGTAIAGKHLLHAIVRTGVTAVTDVKHNAPMPEWLASTTDEGDDA